MKEAFRVWQDDVKLTLDFSQITFPYDRANLRILS